MFWKLFQIKCFKNKRTLLLFSSSTLECSEDKLLENKNASKGHTFKCVQDTNLTNLKKKQKNCLRTVNKHGVGISRNQNPGK